MNIELSLTAFRSLPQFESLTVLLREKLDLPVDYATREQAGELTLKQAQALVVYRLLVQAAV